jgi:hypothetical protein
MLAVYVVNMELCRGEYHNSRTSDSREPPDIAGVYIQSFFLNTKCIAQMLEPVITFEVETSLYYPYSLPSPIRDPRQVTQSLGIPFIHTPIYSLNLARFDNISRAVTQVILHSVGKSKVLVKPSAKPKPSMGGIQPRAYSRAKQAASILYCLTVPRSRWCTLPWG